MEAENLADFAVGKKVVLRSDLDLAACRDFGLEKGREYLIEGICNAKGGKWVIVDNGNGWWVKLGSKWFELVPESATAD